MAIERTCQGGRSRRAVLVMATSACIAFTCATAHTAAASTVVNGDPVSRSIEIAENNKTRTETLEPAGKLTGICPDGCLITITGQADSTYVLEGREQVTIEDGLVYWDGLLDKQGETTPEAFRVGPSGGVSPASPSTPRQPLSR